MRSSFRTTTSEDEIVRQLSTLVQRLPNDLQLVVLELADPASFAILRSVVGHGQALYCNQLSKILHQSRLAQALQERPTEAYETYERVLMARQCVLNSIRSGIVPLRTRYRIIKWKFAEDYGLLFTIETYIHKITVWKLHGDTVERVWTQEGVIDAIFMTHSHRVLVSGALGTLQIWDFANSPKSANIISHMKALTDFVFNFKLSSFQISCDSRSCRPCHKCRADALGLLGHTGFEEESSLFFAPCPLRATHF